ncbi:MULTISPECIES: hypothetical protein [Aliivibrio]|jgi:hypothetical protein|uniref:Outer membrane protein beta-barrel domain-containing protein n=3 Tax=Aliivibrio TaxID=511678 RepID=A0A1B9P3G6_ALILO|nr:MULTISPECIES: hypothetical protein [Aliivibrio]AZL86870.1 hypothetical protein EIJ81_21465 [Aliivibrio salmonicida]MBB1313782.1 hypothetical protein [Aliivibrio sp. SR45-2]OCH23055.1 hypothetical protein A6E04_03905 [Aliivibrio logei]OEF22416.1 hypothetical protein A1Q5_15155 [Aliivibrio logei 5S-186]CAQ81539.1 putative exported protein [Aliivibrio salmonicida LFI1238]
MTPIKTINKIWLLTAALSSSTALANNFPYSFFEARIGTSPGTFGAQINQQFTENAHLVGKIDTEFEGDWDISGGIGFNGPINQFADIYGQLLLHNVKDKSSDKFGDEMLTEVNIGFRMWLVQQIEVGAQYGQLFNSDITKDVGSVHFRFHSTDQLSVGTEAKFGGIYGSQIMMTARFTF